MGIQSSTLPAKAAYKYRACTNAAFKKVRVDELSDAEETDDFMKQSTNQSSLQLNVAKSSDYDGRPPADDADSDPECSGDESIDCASVREGDSLSVDSRSRVGTPRMDPPASRASSKSSRMSPSPLEKDAESPPRLSLGNLPERPRLLSLSFKSAAKSRCSSAPSVSATSAAASRNMRPNSNDTATADAEHDDDDDDAAGKVKPGRKKSVHSFAEAQKAFDEYLSDLTPDNMYKGKVKLRDVNSAIERLRKIGNKVACMEGDEAADLAGKLVAHADELRPMFDLIEIARIRPQDMLLKMKPEQVALFKTLPATFQHQVLTSISLSILGKLATSTAKPDDTRCAMEFISGYKYSTNNVEGQLHLKLLAALPGNSSEASFVKAQAHVLVVLNEFVLKSTKAEFINIFRKLRSEGLAPTLEHHEAGKEAWSSSQCWTDVSALSFMAYLLESQDCGYKKSRLFFSGMAYLNELKQSVSVRLKTFRGQKKVSGDGDIGRYCWESLKAMLADNDGPTSEAVQDATDAWDKIKDNYVLPLADNASTAESKQIFIAAYEKDMDKMPLELARKLARLGQQSDHVQELAEAEAGLQLGMARYWEVLGEEIDEGFVENVRTKLSGDNPNFDFQPKFNTVLEIITVYDDVTLELNPARSASVAISELRERVSLAGEAFDLSSRIMLDPVENVEALSGLWIKHLRIQNSHPRAEFVLDCPKVQVLLTMLRENSCANMIKSFFRIHLNFDSQPSSTLLSKCQKLKGQLPESISGLIDRASTISRIAKFASDKKVGRLPGPCEITSLKAEASILSGFETQPGVREHLDSLNAMWMDTYKVWVAGAQFDEFDEIHELFDGTYKALLEGNISDHEWLETFLDDTEYDAKLKKYQDYLLKALPVKVAATSMSQHTLLDETTAAEIASILKTSTEIVKVARNIELRLGAIVVANALLAKPRNPKTFATELSNAKHFCHVICKVKVAQLPKYVQTKLLETETQGAAASAAVASGSGSTSSSSGDVAPAATTKDEQPPARKKQKLG